MYNLILKICCQVGILLSFGPVGPDAIIHSQACEAPLTSLTGVLQLLSVSHAVP